MVARLELSGPGGCAPAWTCAATARARRSPGACGGGCVEQRRGESAYDALRRAVVVSRWRVPLPTGAEPPIRVFVNGVPQQQGRDYELVGRELHFDKPLEKERLGKGRWTAIFFGLWGSYGKNDSVDVQYRLGGRETRRDRAGDHPAGAVAPEPTLTRSC